MKPARARWTLVAGAVVIAGSMPHAAQAQSQIPATTKGEVLLISAEEAARPAAKAHPSEAGSDRAITRGPRLEIVSPTVAPGKVNSPMPLVVTFKTFGGAEIDTRSLKVTYLRDPPIDLTARVSPFITRGGITIDRALVAPGTHELRFEISDDRKHTTSAIISIDVSETP